MEYNWYGGIIISIDVDAGTESLDNMIDRDGDFQFGNKRMACNDLCCLKRSDRDGDDDTNLEIPKLSEVLGV